MTVSIASRWQKKNRLPILLRSSSRSNPHSRAVLKCDLERLLFHRADPQNRETQDVPLLVDLLHYLVALGLAEISRTLVENDLQEIPFRVIPDLHFFFGHIVTPLFMRSVK